MTDLDILKLIIDKLGNISVPVALDDTIGKPVRESRDMLIMLREAVLKDLEEKEKNDKIPELELELVANELMQESD